jgi:hypothetical protein
LTPPLVISHPPSVSAREQGAFTTIGLPPSVVAAAAQPCCNCGRALACHGTSLIVAQPLAGIANCTFLVPIETT